MDRLSDGESQIKQLKDGGFTDDQVNDWVAKTSGELQQGGYSPDQIKQYFGHKDPDMSDVHAHVKSTLTSLSSEDGGEAKEPLARPVEANDVISAMKAGWGNSVSGLFVSGHKPDVSLPANATMLQSFASNVGQVVGDLPAMLAGGTAGAELGPLGVAAGAFAAPSAMRKMLIDHYEKGDVQDASDFARRVVGTTWEAAKGAITGAATEFTGGLSGAVAGTAGKLAGEVAAQTIVSSGLEGKLPDKKDFINGAVAIGGLHAVGYIPSKLMQIYKNTGAHPADVIEAANNDPSIKQELLSQNQDLPKEAGGGDGGKPPNNNLPAVVGGENLPAKPTADLPPPQKPSGAEEELLSRIGEEKPPDKLPLNETVSDGFSKIWANTVDYTTAIGSALKDMGQEAISKGNAQALMYLHSSVMYKVKGFIEEGTRDFGSGEVNGESLKSVLDEYKEKTGDTDLNKLKAYGVAARTIELANRDIEQRGGIEKATDLGGPERQFLVDNQHVQPYFNRMVDFQNRVIDYVGGSGRYSSDSIQAMKDLNTRYIPFDKIMEKDPLTGEVPYSSKDIKRIGDSDRLLKDPIVQIYKHTASLIKLAHETEASNAFIDAMSPGDKNELIGNHPLLETTIVPEDGEVKSEFPDENPYIRPSKDQAGMPGKNQISYWENGKRTLYDTTPEIAESIKAMAGNKPAMSVWTGLLKPFAALLRLGTVDNPVFAARHAWRQQLTAGTLSQTGLKPFQALQSYHEFLSQSDLVKQFYYDGGAISKIIPDMKDYVDQEIYKLNDKAPFLEKTWNQVKNVAEFSHVALSLHDNMIRFSEYKRSLEQGSTRVEAAYNARTVIPDFQRAGLQMSAWNQVTAFLNVHIQGLARSGEAFAKDYQSARDAASGNPQALRDLATGYVAKNLAYITVPSVLLAWAQSGDDAIKDLPDWQKFNYWAIHVPNWRPASSLGEAMSVKNAYPSLARQDGKGNWQVNDGTIFRLQKPFTTGIFFGSLFDTARDPSKFGSFMKTVGGSALVEPFPTIATPLIEHATNHQFYTGQPIIRQSMENKLPEMQYDQYTSETAKVLGKLISYVPLLREIGPKDAKLASPKVVENYIRGYTGTLGQYAEASIDSGLRAAGIAQPKVGPTATLSDIPFVKEFTIRFPQASPQSISDFQDRYQKSSQVSESIKQLMQEGNIQGAMALQNRYAVNMDRLTGVDRAIQRGNGLIRKIYANTTIDPVQKRQLIDGAMYDMASMAHEGNKLMDEFEKFTENNRGGR